MLAAGDGEAGIGAETETGLEAGVIPNYSDWRMPVSPNRHWTFPESFRWASDRELADWRTRPVRYECDSC